MKITFGTLMVVLATLIAVGCSKNDSGGGSDGGGGATQNPTVPCTPDQFGNLPAACGTPSTASVAFTGSMYGYNQSEKNENSIVRIINRMNTYPVQGSNRNYYGYPSSGGLNYGVAISDGTQFIPVCRTSGIDRCRSECKNFRSSFNFAVSMNQGNGTLHIQAGPYLAPKGCDSRSNGTLLAADIPVWIFKTNGNRGFTIQSVKSRAPLWGNTIEIEIPVGSLDPVAVASSTTNYTGRLKFNGEAMGDVVLAHR